MDVTTSTQSLPTHYGVYVCEKARSFPPRRVKHTVIEANPVIPHRSITSASESKHASLSPSPRAGRILNPELHIKTEAHTSKQNTDSDQFISHFNITKHGFRQSRSTSWVSSIPWARPNSGWKRRTKCPRGRADHGHNTVHQ